MYTWLTLGLIPGFLWAVINHIDKYLLSSIAAHASVKVLMVYSTGFSLIVLPLAFMFGYHDIFINANQAIIQLGGGILIATSIYFGIAALSKEEASKIAPLFLLVPVFGYFFSYLLNGEILSTRELFACAIIIFGALILSLEFNEEGKRFKLKHNVLSLMIGCTSLQAIQEVLFKYATVDNSFAASIFWEHVGIVIFGCILLYFNTGLSTDFIASVRKSGISFFSLNFFSEGLNVAGFIVRTYSLLLAPVAIIMSLNSFQPVFVFLIGIVLTQFFPTLAKERIGARHLLHKSISIVIMLIGTVLITQSL